MQFWTPRNRATCGRSSNRPTSVANAPPEVSFTVRINRSMGAYRLDIESVSCVCALNIAA